MAFPELNFSAQNTLSMNVSTKCKKTDQKITAITKERSEIIFLSDIRLNTSNQSYSSHDLEKKFAFKGYDFFHNSKGSSRGVGILLSKKLDYTINIARYDPSDNYLLLHVTISNYKMILGAVYGPNGNEDNFYEMLDGELEILERAPTILGGDWNATWDNSDVNLNMDVLNMVNIPSRVRSNRIGALSSKFKLTEPFRILNPNKVEFTYVPNAAANTNRSRIDYFLISENILASCKNSSISNSLTSTLFDHKQIYLDFKKRVKKNREKIKDTILKDPMLEYYIKSHIIDCYVNHATVNLNFNANMKNRIQTSIGTIFTKLSEIKILKENCYLNGTADLPEMQNLIDAKILIINNEYRFLPEMEYFENLHLTCTDSQFFEVLVTSIKATALQFQSNFYKLSNIKKDRLKTNLKILKNDYQLNHLLIQEKELQLANILENELREELSLIKNFERLNNEKITPYFLNLVKKPSHTETIENIEKENGEAFDGKADREVFILDFFQKLYKKSSLEPENINIEEFLGNIAEISTLN